MIKQISPIRLILAGILVWSIGLIWLLATFPKDTYHRTSLTGTTNFSIVPLGSHPEICQVLKDKWGSIEGEIEGTIQNLKGYQNLFQTDEGNLGIRIEVTQSGKVALVVSSPLKTEVGKLAFSEAFGTIEAGEKFHLYFQISFNGVLTIKLDDQRAHAVYSNINPTCRNVQLGVGFDVSRKTLGTTKTTITGISRTTSPIPRSSEVAIILLFGIGLTLIFSALTKDSFLRPSRSDQKS
jgi:hypothetical protein